jgi:hypothetical protein
VTVPTRTDDQRLSALAYANHVRLRRAALKRMLKKSSTPRQLAAVELLDPPDWLRTMKASDLLLAVPKVGSARVTLLFARGGVSMAKTVGGLSDRQRQVLVDWLDPEACAAGRRAV